MSRPVPEWRGARPETAPPPRVKLRILDRQGDCCAECGRQFSPACPPEFDHERALVNGGENCERNIRAVCSFCHAPKTASDVAEKAKVARVRAKHLGLKDKPRVPVGGWAALHYKRMPDGRVVPR